MEILLVDGDMVAFRCAASAEHDPLDIALIRVEKMISEFWGPVLKENHVKFYLTSQDNFRRAIYPEYKSNRKQAAPNHLGACKEYLIKEYGAILANGMEADDAMAINQTSKSWIVSNDKDMLQVPGNHYNPITDAINVVSEIEGLRHFYTQLLVGDASDNVSGVAGIGKVKAQRALEGYETELEMFEKVQGMYGDDEALLMNGKLLWLLREEGKLWEFPVPYSTPELELMSKSINEKAHILMGLGSTELIGLPTDGLETADTKTMENPQ